ncbi:MAG: tetratricopeptide repeat protein [Zoogloeaceae bacterium]|jgi:putative thioredoxin|nr:tetratricopeptide repeat protein [Zoogloeaceae bacterium]
MSDFHFDVSLQDFETRVLQASLKTPLLVDFWAEWCAPCKTLKPILEKLADEYQGRFLLAKVDADANPELSAYFGVRSIPTVVMLVNGEARDGFTGARAEADVRAFIDRFVPPPPVDARAEAASLAAAGDWQGAYAMLQAFLAEHPQDEAALLDAVAALLEMGRAKEAEPILAREFTLEAERAQAFRARLSLAGGGADIALLQDKLARLPDDHAARLELARALAGQGRYAEALEAALEVVRRDRHFDDAAGRRLLLELFTIIGATECYDDLVRQYRRALAALLN